MELLPPDLESRFKVFEGKNRRWLQSRVIAKYYDDRSGQIYYATEYDPERQAFFGYVKNDRYEYEHWHTFSVANLSAPGQNVVRDDSFKEQILWRILRYQHKETRGDDMCRIEQESIQTP